MVSPRSFANTIEFPVIVLGKSSGPIDFSAQQTATRERKAHRGVGLAAIETGPDGRVDHPAFPTWVFFW